jgi:hypothetical protein
MQSTTSQALRILVRELRKTGALSEENIQAIVDGIANIEESPQPLSSPDRWNFRTLAIELAADAGVACRIKHGDYLCR